MPTPLKVGLIGTGGISRRHVGAYIEFPEKVQLTAVCDVVEDAARDRAQEAAVAAIYTDAEKMIKEANIDAVDICSPHALHLPHVVAAAEAGKHILCEKPLAASAKDCQRMIDAAHRNNVVLVEAFTHRWNPHLRKARALIADGTIGKVVTIDAVGCSHRTSKADLESIRYSAELEHGALCEVGSYAVYATRFVLSAEPIRVRGVGYDSGDWGVDTTFCGMMEFASGAIANVTSSLEHSSFRFQISIDGREGRIEIPSMFEDSGPLIIKGVDGQNEQTIATPAPNRFIVQLDEFSECVLTGKTPEFPAEDGLRNTAVLEALHESADSGQAINLDLETTGKPQTDV